MLGIHVEFQWCKDFGQIGMKRQMNRSKRITVKVPAVVDVMMHVRMLVHMTDISPPRNKLAGFYPETHVAISKPDKNLLDSIFVSLKL